ncbi:AfsR/SARP family transcriptional regulator [Lentzea sp.]|uniref:AfsR/SARP family transcriptional regulator n=1 Tax=Lentzea sp. TaxID=56099 RepID=UPI002B604FCE|nr:BTAD domain-containing putative transcriptional regulator [Lentzea sp.]HUQ57882.1 BTAD domain-containing putative transcriptional regulator [Lentzea sp.]
MPAEYRVLGPLEVLRDGVAVAVPAGRCRVLLATLLLRPNQFMSVDELVERVWGGAPPTADRADKTLQMVVARLRQALGPANCVQTSSGGYRASVDASTLDLLRFRSLVATGDFAAAVRLWRGPMLSDVRSDALHQHDVPPVVEERLLALERRIAADLEAGRAADLVAELRGLTAEHQFREVFWGQLMMALAQSGQQAAALTVYQDVRALLSDELGVDPGAELRAVHHQVLSGSVRVRGPVPRQLPTAVPRFVGRTSELTGLTDLVRDELVVAAITGTAGVGKTTLAVHWARGVADRFPDGQLYVNLRGFDRHRDPMAPGDALSRFLEALGIAPERIPADLDAAAALYRSLVADRRMLVVLDNARDAEHVRPLLPGPSHCLVLITSRDRLTGLVVNEGMRQLALDVLSHAEAHALLVSRLGADRVGVEAADLIRWCGGLPLALAIVTARAAQSPKLPLSALAAELADERTRLDTLDTGDAATSVRTVFQWSYQQLSAPAARMFRLIGVHPGPDITVAAAASLAGWSVDEARECVRELARANLLVEHVPGRFTSHDLLRVYAADRAAAEETSESRAEARTRMFDHYVHTLAWIDREYNWGERRVEGFPDPRVGSETFDSQPASAEWFDSERAVLRALVALADRHGLDRYSWQLPWFAAPQIDWFGTWPDWLDSMGRGAQAATRVGERRVAAKLLFLQAFGYGRQGNYERGIELFEDSSRAFRVLGVVDEQVRAQSGVAWILGMLNRPHESLEVARRALELQRSEPDADPDRVAMALYQVAFALVEAGRYQEGLERLAEWDALNRVHELSPGSLGQTAVTRSRALIGLGRTGGVVEMLHRALGWFGQMGGLMDRAATHEVLGDAHHELGELTEARRWWTESLAYYESRRHPHAEQLRAKLAALPEN